MKIKFAARVSATVLAAAFSHSAVAQADSTVVTAPDVEAMTAHQVEVKRLGARGDGVADDTRAWQNAFDGGRRTVVIPAGTYLISAALQLDSETLLRADPQATIRLADNAGNGVGGFLLKNRDEHAGHHDIVVDGFPPRPRDAAERRTITRESWESKLVMATNIILSLVADLSRRRKPSFL